MSDLKVEYFDPDYDQLIESLASIKTREAYKNVDHGVLVDSSFYNHFKNKVQTVQDQELTNMATEDVIESERLTLRYCSCPFCLTSIAKKIVRGDISSDYGYIHGREKGIKIKGICSNLDHVYLGWLASGKERVLFMNCPHSQGFQNCYYIKGKARIYLGSKIKENINEYKNVQIVMRLSDKVKRTLIKRHLF